MTLALLITAVTGAWADEPKVYDSGDVELFSLQVGDILMPGVTLKNSDVNNIADANIISKRYSIDGVISQYSNSISSIPFSIGENGLLTAELAGNGPYNCMPITEDGKAGNAWVVMDIFAEPNYKTILIGGTTYPVPSGPEVTPVTGKTNEWTFAMPGSDVVLTPIYSAATISHAAGTPEASETPFETLKEAFAAVKSGDVIKLDWNVTLTETVETLPRDGAINFTLDLNGYIIDGMTPENAIRLRNGDYMTITDSSLGQTGGLKCQNSVGEQGAKFVFDGGRYTMGQATADLLNTVCSEATAAILLAKGKEFIDLEGGAEANDGFMVRVGFKTFELAIDSKRFATFYSDMNIEFAEKPAEGVGLYTISSEGIDLDNNIVKVTKVNDPIALAGMPLLVYNGTTEQKTVTLKVTPDAPTAGQMWSSHFQGTAVDKTFDADAMAKADYYALSGGKAFAPVKGAGTLGANQCWLQFDKQEIPSARQFTLVFDSEATGIKTTDCTDYTDSVWYDLNGRKVAAHMFKKLIAVISVIYS